VQFPNQIKDYCKSNFTNNLKNIERTTLLHWNQKKGCHDYDFDKTIENIKGSYSGFVTIWQKCTEFGQYPTSSSDNHSFTKNIPIDFFYNICTRLFGDEYGEARVERGVKETNNMYGGLKPNVSNVVFFNGGLDPWSKLSVLQDISEHTPAIVIPNIGHAAPLGSDDDEDPEELKEARAKIRNLVKHWIGEDKYNKSGPYN
jgi:hypothetical protein